jgi:glyoxylase-like metal-dependent hydrolase (beta-lactamase superfamily II)
LIFGARNAVLVDPLTTVSEATALADWVGLHDPRLTTIYITHSHGDHYLGQPVVLGRFPDARPVATTGTVRQMQEQPSPAVEEDRLRARFPNQIADTCSLPEPLDSAELQLEGYTIEVFETGHTDTLDSTSLHVRDLGLTVSGDVADNHSHMYVGATMPESRPNGSPRSTGWPRSTPPPWMPGTRTQPKATRRTPRRVPRLPRVLEAAT